MGTRADFYIGRTEEAEWLGSIAWDGYPDGNPAPVMAARTLEEFTAAVDGLREREDWTSPEMGWPWPWETSATTDYAYAWDDGVWWSCFGGAWQQGAVERDDDGDRIELPGPAPTFPDMTSRQKVNYGERSGLLIFGAGEA